MKAILASNNQFKLKEIRALLSEKFENIFSLKDKNIQIEIEETGDTFLENALIKASTISKMTGLVAIADDSGICVDALNGAPGIFSARFAGENCDDNQNNLLLLKKLQELEITHEKDRKAYFASVVVLYYPNGEYVYGEGKVDGLIIDDYRGENGFGYDPIFYCNELGKTFGEADTQEKNTISHRAKALADLIKKL